MADKAAGAFKGREDHRRARELEEARKAGTIPAEKDEDGNEINPHIPQFMSQAPWYLGQEAPGLKHQKNLKEKKAVATATDFVPRGRKMGAAATVFRKGACTNCGAMTHKAIDCVERPRKKGAKYTGKDIKPDEYVPDMAFDYAGKRDHWANYDASDHVGKLKQYEKEVEIRLKAKQREKMANVALKESDRAARRKAKREEKARKKRAEGGGDEGDGEEEADTDNDTDTDDDSDDDDDAKEKDDEAHVIGQNVGANKNQGSAKMSVRNLRIREDTAKYLLNLDVNSAFYDPKTRSMRNNPLAGTPCATCRPRPRPLSPRPGPLSPTRRRARTLIPTPPAPATPTPSPTPTRSPPTGRQRRGARALNELHPLDGRRAQPRRPAALPVRGVRQGAEPAPQRRPDDGGGEEHDGRARVRVRARARARARVRARVRVRTP